MTAPARDPGPWAALASARSFPNDPSASSGIEWIQTHLSHVYRTRARVYKFRKPVDLGFVCFSSREERNADCLREVSLNRRLAPDVYLGVAPLFANGSVGTPAESLTGESASLEHCVVMRRLADGRDALSLLERAQLSGAQLDALAGRIARFHAANGLGTPAPLSAEEWLARCSRPAEENLRMIGNGGDLAAGEALAHARDLARTFAAEHADRFERRRREGRAVDGHGDLHLQHVWYERDDADPIAIDCLEFSESLRRIDAAADVAFLAMDLRYRGAQSLGERFLRTYARESDDFDLYSVVDYFIAYRAGVRAKVAALAARDPAIAAGQRARAAESAARHLALAADALLPTGAKPALVLVCGIVGTGKSSVAGRLSDRLDAVVIASDRIRKRLLGLPATARPGSRWREGAYAPEQTERTYAGMLERARPVLASGRSAILDATFSSRAHRSEAVRLARSLGCDAFAVEVRCAPDVARRRLALRAAAGTDPSDAGPESYAPSASGFEPLREWPEESRAAIDTDRDDWDGLVSALAARIRGRSH